MSELYSACAGCADFCCSVLASVLWLVCPAARAQMPFYTDDTEVTVERMTEEELLKGLEGLAPPEEQPEDDE